MILRTTSPVQRLDELLCQICKKHHLTAREGELLKLLVMGLSNKEMAIGMGISGNTVKALLHLIKLKMAAPSRAAVMANVLSGALSQREDIPSS